MISLPLADFTPLLDPLTALYPRLSDYWLWLAIPLVIAIGIVYKGTRIADVTKLPRAVLIWSIQVVLAMIFAGLLLSGIYWVWIRFW